MTSSLENGFNIITNVVPNRTGPSVRWSKRPLLASCTSFKCSLGNLPEFGNYVKFGYKFNLRYQDFVVINQIRIRNNRLPLVVLVVCQRT